MPNHRHVVLGTISFTVCFAAWGLIGAFAPRFREAFHLTAAETAFLVAVPVLLGSLARIPMGMLTDRFGGRAVFSILMAAAAVPVWLVPQQATYSNLVGVAFVLGLAGSSFAIGVGYVSRWTPAERQGGALGVYGLGNIGQSAAVFLGPVLAAQIGMPRVFHGVAVMLVCWAAVFAALARNAPAPAAASRKGIAAMLAVLTREKFSWLLSAFYFLTFGGFVAFSIYLPTLLKDEFQLTPADAGFRTAGFVVLATLLRPLGGWLSDRIGGARVLSAVFAGVAPFALLLAWPSIIPFTVGALGCAALLGLGNGAVFKLVPQYFPGQTGTVTGLVGAMGGLGGFFPPLLAGVFPQPYWDLWPGFLLLASTALAAVVGQSAGFRAAPAGLDMALPAELRRTADRLRAGAWATLWTALLIAAIVVGSRNLQNFDPALVIYTFAVVFATWGVVYHYNVWLDKAAHARLLGPRMGAVPQPRSAAQHAPRALSGGHAPGRADASFAAVRACAGGCISSCSGAACWPWPSPSRWSSAGFTSAPLPERPADLRHLPVRLSRRAVSACTPCTAFLLFHGLDISAMLVLAGIALSLWRRMTDKGARTLQQFGMDFLPIILLFAISVTGLALTVSQEWLRGSAYSFLAILHAITVIAALLFLPFGKFFHIFQRPAQLGVKLYQDAGRARSGSALRAMRRALRFAYAYRRSARDSAASRLRLYVPGAAGYWQELCPACKRKTLSTAQMRIKEAARG